MFQVRKIKAHAACFMAISLLFFSCAKESTNSSNNGQPGTGGSLARFTISGSHLYVVDNTTLKTFDITNPGSIVQSSSVVIGTGVETIFPYKDNLYIGSQTGMFVYLIANPANPAYLGEAIHVRSCDPVIANDTAAFVTLRSGSACGSVNDGLYVYDTRNLFAPRLINNVDIPTPYGLGMKDSALYVCAGVNGMSVLNVSDISSPRIIRSVAGYDFRDVIPYRQMLICYVTDGVALYDINDLFAPTLIKKINNQ
jgi:hypothetical protein